jgi:hypothetical protein
MVVIESGAWNTAAVQKRNNIISKTIFWSPKQTWNSEDKVQIRWSQGTPDQQAVSL